MLLPHNIVIVMSSRILYIETKLMIKTVHWVDYGLREFLSFKFISASRKW